MRSNADPIPAPNEHGEPKASRRHRSHPSPPRRKLGVQGLSNSCKVCSCCFQQEPGGSGLGGRRFGWRMAENERGAPRRRRISSELWSSLQRLRQKMQKQPHESTTSTTTCNESLEVSKAFPSAQSHATNSRDHHGERKRTIRSNKPNVENHGNFTDHGCHSSNLSQKDFNSHGCSCCYSHGTVGWALQSDLRSS